MASCVRCGGELPPAARFCPTCGRPVDPEVGPPAPPATPPIWSGLRLAGWAGADWALVGLGVARSLLLLFGASALIGLVAAVAVGGNVSAAPCGAAVGSHLAFAAFGARVAAACGGDHGAALALGFLPLPWVLTGGLATEAALRFGWRRLPDDRVRRMAYAGKLAVAGGVALGIIAGLVARGDPNPQGSTFGSAVNGGEVWFYTTVLTWFWAWIGLRRRGVRLLRGAGDGAGRFGGFRLTAGLGGAGGLGGADGLGGPVGSAGFGGRPPRGRPPSPLWPAPSPSSVCASPWWWPTTEPVGSGSCSGSRSSGSASGPPWSTVPWAPHWAG